MYRYIECSSVWYMLMVTQLINTGCMLTVKYSHPVTVCLKLQCSVDGQMFVAMSLCCSEQCLCVGDFTLSLWRPRPRCRGWRHLVPALQTAAPSGRGLRTSMSRRWSGICQSKSLRRIRCLCRAFRNCVLKLLVYSDVQNNCPCWLVNCDFAGQGFCLLNLWDSCLRCSNSIRNRQGMMVQ